MSFLAFLLTATLLALTPGPGIAYVVARTVAGGRAEGLASCLGTGIGGLIHVAAAALGLSVLIAQSAVAFDMVKYVGAAYLVYLGIRMLTRKMQDSTTPRAESRGAASAFAQGIAVETLNVKTALFFLAFLPQFLSTPDPSMAQVVLLGGICVALNTLVDVAAVLMADRLLAAGPARAGRARLMTRSSGVVMVGLGLFLALARRDA